MNNMKKYNSPESRVVELNADQQLLSGSLQGNEPMKERDLGDAGFTQE